MDDGYLCPLLVLWFDWCIRVRRACLAATGLTNNYVLAGVCVCFLLLLYMIYIHFMAMFLSMDKWSYSCVNRFVENTTAVCDMSLYFLL